MPSMRPVMDIIPVSPTAYGRVGHAILTCQLTITDAGRCGLNLSTDLGRRGGLLMYFNANDDFPRRIAGKAPRLPLEDKLYVSIDDPGYYSNPSIDDPGYYDFCNQADS